MAVLDPADRSLLRTVPDPLTTKTTVYLRVVLLAGSPPTSSAAPIAVEPIVSSSDGIVITRKRIQLSCQHAAKLLTHPRGTRRGEA